MRCQVFSFPLGLTMSIAIAWPQCLAFFDTPLVIEPSPGQLSGDAGPANGSAEQQVCRTNVMNFLRKK
jgi:hypothetical protein